MGVKINLSKATEVTFDPIPAGTYNAVVFECEVNHTGGGGKLPEGTPYLNVQFKVDEPDTSFDNKRVWATYMIAPDGVENKDKMDGILFGFLKALGVMSDPGKVEVEPDELQGMPCKIVVGIDPAKTLTDGRKVDARNRVKRVKSITSDEESSDALLPN
jgi:Protein of unknown function (DUF669).